MRSVNPESGARADGIAQWENERGCRAERAVYVRDRWMPSGVGVQGATPRSQHRRERGDSTGFRTRLR
ncbi:hypothetical protein CEK65_15720 [Xanthomonas sp. LMG 12459]|nr:hypothetical protein CEK65_15720 [Xanthomonas sp. LMG 12459]